MSDQDKKINRILETILQKPEGWKLLDGLAERIRMMRLLHPWERHQEHPAWYRPEKYREGYIVGKDNGTFQILGQDLTGRTYNTLVEAQFDMDLMYLARGHCLAEPTTKGLWRLQPFLTDPEMIAVFKSEVGIGKIRRMETQFGDVTYGTTQIHKHSNERTGGTANNIEEALTLVENTLDYMHKRWVAQ